MLHNSTIYLKFKKQNLSMIMEDSGVDLLWKMLASRGHERAFRGQVSELDLGDNYTVV